MFNPETGKTHQLRIVSKNLGCPIIGDNKYNVNSKFKNEKLMLHAYGLEFLINKNKYEFQSEFPEYFLHFIKKNNLKKIKSYKNYLNFF